MRSALTTGSNSQEAYINVTWTPSDSQLGMHMFCYTATDNYMYVKKLVCKAQISGYSTIKDRFPSSYI